MIYNLSDARSPELVERAIERDSLSSDVLLKFEQRSGPDILRFVLPDALRALGNDAEACHSIQLGRESHLLILAEQFVFIQADWHIAQFDLILRLWTQIDHFQTAAILNAHSQARRNWSHSTLSCCANAIPLYSGKPGDSVALFSMAEIEFTSAIETPRIRAVDDTTSAIPGFEEIFADAAPEPIRTLLEKSRANTSQTLELASHARICFTAANTFFLAKNYDAARSQFHQAQRAGHPLALEKELEAQALLSKPLHNEYPEVFDWIRRGDRGRALFTLRDMARKYPEEGNAILSYALRNLSEPEEGLRAAEISLRHNTCQSDVLANRWSFLVESNQHSKLVEAAIDHIRLYPQDAVAQRNLVDSLIAAEDFERAIVAAHFHLIFAQNTQNAIQSLFSAYEAIEAWPLLADLLDTIMKTLRGPTPKTLILYGECLTEVQRFEESFACFEQAMSLEPGNANVVLGFARALARADREQMAIDLLSSVLADPNRIDKVNERALLISLLAEIYRRTGRWELALASFESELGTSLIDSVDFAGPMPALEYSESLILAGRAEEARELLRRVQSKCPGDRFVDELEQIAASSC
jgi:tetratricopeptide (TPR) repeat protein